MPSGPRIMLSSGVSSPSSRASICSAGGGDASSPIRRAVCSNKKTPPSVNKGMHEMVHHLMQGGTPLQFFSVRPAAERAFSPPSGTAYSLLRLSL